MKSRLRAVLYDGGAIGCLCFGDGRGADVLIAEETVFEAIDPAMHGQTLAMFPSVAHDSGLANIGDLFDDV